jgi:hypothetical protein
MSKYRRNKVRGLINRAFAEWSRWSGRLDAEEGDHERQYIEAQRKYVLGYLRELEAASRPERIEVPYYSVPTDYAPGSEPTEEDRRWWADYSNDAARVGAVK